MIREVHSQNIINYYYYLFLHSKSIRENANIAESMNHMPQCIESKAMNNEDKPRHLLLYSKNELIKTFRL